MIRNYLTAALRNLWRQRSVLLLNLVGLSVSVAAFLIISSIIDFHRSFDEFVLDSDRVYRVGVTVRTQEQENAAYFVSALAPAIREEIPDVEEVARISAKRDVYVSVGTKRVHLSDLRHADPSVGEVLGYRMITGDARIALSEPRSLVLTQSVSRAIFGDDDPVGRPVHIDGDEYHVTGVIEDPPRESHLEFSALVSFSTLEKDPRVFLGWDGGNQYATYVKLKPGADRVSVEAKFGPPMWRNLNSRLVTRNVRFDLYLQPITRIHLEYEPDSGVLQRNLWIFGVAGALVMLIGCINFVNVSLAYAFRRVKEMSIRKMMGAFRRDLVLQFALEAFLLSSLTLMGAVLLVELSDPWIRSATGVAEITLTKRLFWLGVTLLILVSAMVAGPAAALARVSPIHLMRAVRIGGGRARMWMVGTQFAICISLIACTLDVHRQIEFIQTSDLGFEKENVLVIPLVGDVRASWQAVKGEMEKVSGVRSVTAVSQVPSQGFDQNGYRPQGQDEVILFHAVHVDADFFDVFDIPLMEGRSFDRRAGQQGYLINQTLAKQLAWEPALGKIIRRNGDHEVIGVVEDFHYSSLHERIEPLVVTYHSNAETCEKLAVRISGGDVQETVEAIEDAWKRVLPETVMEFSFLDEQVQKLYEVEERARAIISAFSLLAVMLALSGLYSLVACAVQQRTKEIGIRKVLGSSISGVTTLLASSFVLPVLLANLIAWPASAIAIHSWLEGFAYRVDVSLFQLATASVVSLLIALTVVVGQSANAARKNPVEALRYE